MDKTSLATNPRKQNARISASLYPSCSLSCKRTYVVVWNLCFCKGVKSVAAGEELNYGVAFCFRQLPIMSACSEEYLLWNLAKYCYNRAFVTWINQQILYLVSSYLKQHAICLYEDRTTSAKTESSNGSKQSAY